jgi:hypothetical protein
LSERLVLFQTQLTQFARFQQHFALTAKEWTALRKRLSELQEEIPKVVATIIDRSDDTAVRIACKKVINENFRKRNTYLAQSPSFNQFETVVLVLKSMLISFFWSAFY